jgi:hypothetical protein
MTSLLKIPQGIDPSKPHHVAKLGWEFQFLVPISGTPIGSGIPILFLVPKIPVGFFFQIPLLKN